MIILVRWTRLNNNSSTRVEIMERKESALLKYLLTITSAAIAESGKKVLLSDIKHACQ